MDKTEKLLRKLTREDRKRITIALSLIYNSTFDLLDFKKLSGTEDVYRVRVGNFRIKFIKHKDYNEIVSVTRRDDNTY